MGKNFHDAWYTTWHTLRIPAFWMLLIEVMVEVFVIRTVNMSRLMNDIHQGTDEIGAILTMAFLVALWVFFIGSVNGTAAVSLHESSVRWTTWWYSGWHNFGRSFGMVIYVILWVFSLVIIAILAGIIVRANYGETYNTTPIVTGTFLGIAFFASPWFLQMIGGVFFNRLPWKTSFIQSFHVPHYGSLLAGMAYIIVEVGIFDMLSHLAYFRMHSVVLHLPLAIVGIGNAVWMLSLYQATRPKETDNSITTHPIKQ